MSDATEDRLEAVPARAKRAREAMPRWGWVEPTVWTERMLTALDEGVKGGRWFSLIDKVHPERNLHAAFSRVAANDGAAGVDHVNVTMFVDRLDAELVALSDALRTGTYRPQAIRRHWIPKPGSQEGRPLGIPTVRDRVVQTALRQVLEPIFERDFAPRSYGFRPGKGCKDALRRVEELLHEDYACVVDVDLKSYFDTIPHNRLLALVAEKVSDGKVLSLIDAFLRQGVLDGLAEWTPEQGTPQGAVISPLLSNIYLDPLDHLMAERNFEMVRYADDFVILCRTAADAATALDVIRRWTAEAGLTLHPTKTRVIDATSEPFDFLGYRFEGGTRRPRPKSLEKFKETVRAKTSRSAGDSLSTIIATLNPTLRGWFEYFKHSHKWTFPRLDGWIRMRLRSILRKRMKLTGRGRGVDHTRWPNAFFADQGLYSLKRAHELARQPSLR
ncbi:group II intron reverse transcriptase/maturase [Singulisphaera sp. Ch08]|uniref:Group II intron reverse transcriptase/maturase n=1 Tax=Singulisphaera sp. Ch08 TaxID=3120278 RepID=A0AAU7CPX3_9BACT